MSDHWFEPVADHLGSAYLRYAFTKRTEHEVDTLVDVLDRGFDGVLDAVLLARYDEAVVERERLLAPPSEASSCCSFSRLISASRRSCATVVSCCLYVVGMPCATAKSIMARTSITV